MRCPERGNPVLVVASFRQSSDRTVVRLCGELDLSTHDLLLDYLSRVKIESRAVMRLDLAGLSFCDARGGWLLLDYVERAGRQARSVTLDNVGPAVRRVLDLVDVWVSRH